jgi:hypothetical protein
LPRKRTTPCPGQVDMFSSANNISK